MSKDPLEIDITGFDKNNTVEFRKKNIDLSMSALKGMLRHKASLFGTHTPKQLAEADWQGIVDLNQLTMLAVIALQLERILGIIDTESGKDHNFIDLLESYKRKVNEEKKENEPNKSDK